MSGSRKPGLIDKEVRSMDTVVLERSANAALAEEEQARAERNYVKHMERLETARQNLVLATREFEEARTFALVSANRMGVNLKDDSTKWLLECP
jgi:hypothetical protein